MTAIDPKALVAAEKKFDEMTGHNWNGIMAMSAAIQAYLDAADLVESSEVEGLQAGLKRASQDWLGATKERDKARREADDYLHELVDERARADDAFKLQAALRATLLRLVDDFGPDVDADGWKDTFSKRHVNEARALLTDTAEAAAQWQRVPEGYVVAPVKPTEEMLAETRGVEEHRAKAGFRWKKHWAWGWQRMIAAAPKAGEGPESE